MDSQRYARRVPAEPLHRHDMRARPASAQTVGVLEVEVQLHVMLHVYRGLHERKSAKPGERTPNGSSHDAAELQLEAELRRSSARTTRPHTFQS